VTKKTVYISGALTNMDETQRVHLRAFYEDLGLACEAAGFDAYLPHKASDPTLARGMTPQEVDRLDRGAVTSSCLIVVYATIPSLGVGIEIEMANNAGIPIVLLTEERALELRQVSRLALGNPAVREVLSFKGPTGARAKLLAFLEKFRAELHAA
jgi:hypothetical protein